MSFNNLSAYLAKFKDLKPSDAYIGEGLQRAIQEALGEEIKKESMKYQKGTMFLVVDSNLKSEIFLHKKKILALANENIGKVILKDIV